MINLKKLSILALLVILVTATRAQEGFQSEKLKHYATLGYNIGAAAPLGLPNTIRKIKSYSPLFTPSFGYEATYDLSSKWFVGAGLRLDFKGMKVTDSVQYFRTEITVGNGGSDDGVFEGDFTGTNATEANNTYLTMPIYGGYRAGAWNVKLGMYFAVLLSSKFEGNVSDGYIRKGGSLGEKVLIDHATFDFGDKMRSYDIGLHAGVERELTERWQVNLTGQMGFVPLFPSSFKGVGYDLHNMFVTAGVSYRIW